MPDDDIVSCPDVVDLTGETCETILGLCRELVASGDYVLHGGNRAHPLRVIEPRQANDAAKWSGNLLAVYGSTNVEAVIMHAVLDRAYLSSRFENYTIGYRMISGRVFFKATDNLYELFQQKDPQLFSTGYVYALEKFWFTQVPESICEFFALQAVAPRQRLKIARSLGSRLFRIDSAEGDDTIVRYSLAEKARIEAHMESQSFR
jgi:hypothetical protein